MPAYGSSPNTTRLYPGQVLTLFNNETLTAPASSIAFSRGGGPVEIDKGVTFAMQFTNVPTSSVVVQGSNVDVAGNYQTLYTSTNKQQDFYTDTGCWQFYRVQLASGGASNPLTVVAQR